MLDTVSGLIPFKNVLFLEDEMIAKVLERVEKDERLGYQMSRAAINKYV